MPELPEVEVVRAGMAPAVTGASVTSVTVYDERSLRRHPGPSEDFIERLVGRTLLRASRRGKFLWIPLGPVVFPAVAPVAPFPKTKEILPSGAFSGPFGENTGVSPSFSEGEASFSGGEDAGGPREALVIHLGMSGQVLLRDTATDDLRTRVRIDLLHPVHGALRVNFVDQRIFGSMAIDDLVPATDAGGQFIPRGVAHIARDPMDPNFDDKRFLAALGSRNSAIKRALLDQNLISGIGNIYADEALWAARVHYDQPAATLSRARAKTLLSEVRHVLGSALASGGTSFDTHYVDVNGASGYFSRSLNVYGQQGKPCPRCGRIVVRENFMNRGSHFCPFCQRLR